MSVPFYNLDFNPFVPGAAPATVKLISRDYLEMMGQLSYLTETRGIGLFTARPGMGKSYCLRQFAEELQKKQSSMEYLALTTVSISDFYTQLSNIMGLPPKGRKGKLFHQFQERVRYLYYEQRNPLILAIDEAQYLSDKILQDLQLLMNYNYDSENLFTLILCGEQTLNERLSTTTFTALRQRLMVHYTFKGLDEKEMAEYIYAKIEAAGGNRSMIEPSALISVQKYSGGSPRLIDNVMGYALLLGGQMQRETIGPDLTAAAVNAQKLK